MDIENRDSISVLNYNIFFGKLDTDTEDDILERVDAICTQICEINPTIVCMQEVTPGRYNRIVTNLSKTYPYRVPLRIITWNPSHF